LSDSILEREQAIADKMGWTHLGGVHKNDGWDMETPDGSKIAIRFDEISLDSGAHYLELEQRSDRDSKWKSSGFGLARKNADWWVMANSEKIYVTSTKKLWTIVKKAKGSDERHSRRNLEDPDKRLFSRAHIISIEDLAACSIAVINQ
jgi:hypothetical protein|tara:strand:- start:1316 stop:1759 length:444 start_codon:yes stop_codon:yes gene_type:complete